MRCYQSEWLAFASASFPAAPDENDPARPLHPRNHEPKTATRPKVGSGLEVRCYLVLRFARWSTLLLLRVTVGRCFDGRKHTWQSCRVPIPDPSSRGSLPDPPRAEAGVQRKSELSRVLPVPPSRGLCRVANVSAHASAPRQSGSLLLCRFRARDESPVQCRGGGILQRLIFLPVGQLLCQTVPVRPSTLPNSVFNLLTWASTQNPRMHASRAHHRQTCLLPDTITTRWEGTKAARRET
jgi:hypothetical protein